MSDASQRTEKPTQRRLEKARKEGRFPASREATGAAQFLAFALLLGGFGASWCANFFETMRRLLAKAFTIDLTPASASALAREIAWRDATPLLAGGGVLALATLAAHLAGTRLGFSFKPLTPDFNRLNPMQKLSELPKQNIPMFLQGLVLIPVFGLAIWGVVGDNIDAICRLPLQPVQHGAHQLTAAVEALVWKAAALFLVFGIIDYVRQHRRWSAQLRMTKQEIRQEMKENEGSPQVKGRIRRLQRDYARRRMLQDVPKATAVVVNPTHFAVAIRYNPQSSAAPLVVAKGKNLLALRIRRIATENQVPIIENPPLAQALYKACEVGQEIPAHLYRAVAEVLAYIYRLMGGRLP